MSSHERVIQSRISLDISVPLSLHSKLHAAAKAAGVPFAAYCQLLFDQAYAAKVGRGQDVDIDRFVSACVLMAGLDEEAVSRVLGVELAMVRRVRKAWVSTWSIAGSDAVADAIKGAS